METHAVYDVFTPDQPAKDNFVERLAINEELVDALLTPGRQLVVCGTAGSGKTTLIQNKLEQVFEGHVTTHCGAGMKISDLMVDAFDQLAPFYTAEKTERHKKAIAPSLRAGYLGIKAQLAGQMSKESEQKRRPVLSPRLTIRRLAAFLGEVAYPWVLDDFHLISRQERENLTEVMNIFADLARTYGRIKVVAVGVGERASRLVPCDARTARRIAEIRVPLMTSVEIETIVMQGEQLLNISMARNVKKNIMQYSGGDGGVCHRLALNSCLDAGVERTAAETVPIRTTNSDYALTQCFEKQFSTMKDLFEIALSQGRGAKHDHYQLILTALAMDNTNLGLTKTDILTAIRDREPSYAESNLIPHLVDLGTRQYGATVGFDPVSQRYSFLNPLYKAVARALLLKAGQKRGPKVRDVHEIWGFALSERHARRIKKALAEFVSALD
jgi:hypothetical protein